MFNWLIKIVVKLLILVALVRFAFLLIPGNFGNWPFSSPTDFFKNPMEIVGKLGDQAKQRLDPTKYLLKLPKIEPPSNPVKDYCRHNWCP